MQQEASGSSGLVCERFAGDLFEQAWVLKNFVSSIMNSACATMSASVYFHDHRFAVLKV